MFGLFSRKDSHQPLYGRQFTSDYRAALKELKKLRVNFCEDSGMSLSEMGKDLADIERRAKEFYSFSVSHLESGHSHDKVYGDLIKHHVSNETDLLILDKLFTHNKD